jgi:uncharacterized protein (UPF0548 family)
MAFLVLRPSAEAVAKEIAAAARLPVAKARFLSLESNLKVGPLKGEARLPFGFVTDHSRTVLGSGEATFEAAKEAFRRWRMFDLGWVRVANPEAPIAVGQIVAVEVRALELWSVNLSQIIETVDLPMRFGFIYSTTRSHVEEGEEGFLLEHDRASDEVVYGLDAVSRPRALLARLGLPVTRHFQHRFARDSCRRMREEAERG